MITHVVLFTLEDPADIDATVAVLAGMEGRIPALKGIEVGRDFTRGDRSADLALITRHDDRAGLEAYRVHPLHQQVLEHMGRVVERAVAVDFET